MIAGHGGGIRQRAGRARCDSNSNSHRRDRSFGQTADRRCHGPVALRYGALRGAGREEGHSGRQRIRNRHARCDELSEVRHGQRVGQNVASDDRVRVIRLVDRQVDRWEESKIDRQVCVRVAVAVVGWFGRRRQSHGFRDNSLTVERIAVVIAVDVVVGVRRRQVAVAAEESSQDRAGNKVRRTHTHDIAAGKEGVEAVRPAGTSRRTRDEGIDSRCEVIAAVGVLVQVDRDARDSCLGSIEQAVVVGVVPNEITQREKLRIREVDRLDRWGVKLNQLQLTIDRLASRDFHLDGTDVCKVRSAARLRDEGSERHLQRRRRRAAGVRHRQIRQRPMRRIGVDANLQDAVRMIGSREEFEIPRGAAVGQIKSAQSRRVQCRTISVDSIPGDNSASAGHRTGGELQHARSHAIRIQRQHSGRGAQLEKKVSLTTDDFGGQHCG